MADFINFEAEADFCQDTAEDVRDEVSKFSGVGSENSFIDDHTDAYDNTDPNFSRHFENVENNIEQVLKDAYNEGLEDIESFDVISNLREGSEEESEIDNYKNFEVDIQKFNETLFPRVDAEDQKVHNQFSCTILYALRFDKTGIKDQCDKKEFEKSIDKGLIEKLIDKFEFIIDLQKFQNMRYEINSILSKYNYFLRVFELKNKYR